MVTLILIIAFGLVFGYFATLNTTNVYLHFLQYSSRSFPLYLVILASIGIGILITLAINFLRWFSTTRKLSSKEKDLKQAQEEINDLRKRVHKLELENIKLKAELGKEDVGENAL